MTDESVRRAVLESLKGVTNPKSGQDVVAGGQVGHVSVEDGVVSFAFSLRRGDPGSLVPEARRAAEGVDGVAKVKVDVRLPQSPPVGGASKGGLRPGSVPAPTPAPDRLANVTRVVAISSGKGGVGKSMVATNLAAAAARTGRRVGLLDADIYGPNIPTMFGESRRPVVTGEKGSEMIEPLDAHGVRLMSLGFLLDPAQPAIMRGPLIAGILKQFMEQVEWGPLDLMFVDMPPGTGDAQLSLVQTVDLDGAVMVTTPQKVATGDVRRGIKMFERVNTRVLGIIENMAGFQVPGSGEIVDLFGRGGGEDLATEMSVPFLGRVPLDLAVREAGDAGVPTVVSSPDSPAGRALVEMADALVATLDGMPNRTEGGVPSQS
ncbi:MAG: Mrp/NBP35 family ATP-binding protein [Gemmatimonadetes bacterium]|nr:Mrp/NBP35 family ATP-binding protein [Gemmatimonadota bacterium]